MAKVLHIDDDQAVRAVIGDMLRDAGFQPLSAERLVDGIQLALAEKPSLIVVDLHMPDGDGFEACAALKAVPELASVPILMVTAVRDPEHVAHARACGAADVLHKPFTAPALIAAVRALQRIGL